MKLHRPKITELEQALGKYAEVTLYDDTVLHGIFKKINDISNKENPNYYLNKNYYTSHRNVIFKASHIRTIEWSEIEE